MQNTICLTGRLTKEPEQRHAGNKPMVVCSIAVAKKFKKPDQPDSDFFDLVLWSPQQGDYLVNYGGKGRLVAVSGRMESRTYNDNDGNKRTAWTVNVSEVSILDRPKEGEAGESRTNQSAADTRRSTTSTADDPTIGSIHGEPPIEEFDPFL